GGSASQAPGGPADIGISRGVPTMPDEKKFSYVLAFDGKDDFVQLPAMTIDYSQGFSVEAWVRWNSYKSWAKVIDFGNGVAMDNLLLLNAEATRGLSFAVFIAAQSSIVRADVLDTGTWIHVAGTIDAAGNMTLYKNGKPVQTGKGSRPNSIRR